MLPRSSTQDSEFEAGATEGSAMQDTEDLVGLVFAVTV